MWENNKGPIVPVTVLTDFLGSGKSSLLNHILKHNTRIVVIIENEFGETGVDEKYFRNTSKKTSMKSWMVKGCTCYTVRGALVTPNVEASIHDDLPHQW